MPAPAQVCEGGRAGNTCCLRSSSLLLPDEPGHAVRGWGWEGRKRSDTLVHKRLPVRARAPGSPGRVGAGNRPGRSSLALPGCGFCW